MSCFRQTKLQTVFLDKGTRYVEHVHRIFVTPEFHSYRWCQLTFAFALNSRIFAYTYQSNRVPIYATLNTRKSDWSIRVHSLRWYVLHPISLIFYMIVVHLIFILCQESFRILIKKWCRHTSVFISSFEKCSWIEFYCKLIVLISHNMFLKIPILYVWSVQLQ